MKSAGGDVMPLSSTDLQYMVREPNTPHPKYKDFLRGWIRADEALYLNWRCRQGMVYFDGSHLCHPIKFGSKIEISSFKAPALQIFVAPQEWSSLLPISCSTFCRDHHTSPRLVLLSLAFLLLPSGYPWPYCYWMVLHAKTTRMVWRSPILEAYYAFSKTKCQTQKMLCLLVKYDTFHITLGAILSLPWTWDMGHVENMTVSPPSLWTLVFTCLVHISKPSYLGS